jgi:hypothetical protein
VDDRAGFYRCLREARRGARACVYACHEEHPCAGDFRACLGECRIGP